MSQATEEDRNRDQIAAQLAYMLDEIDALKSVLTAFPDELLEAEPYEGEPSVRDLFAQLSARESAVRIPNVERFVSAGEEKPALIEGSHFAEAGDNGSGSTADMLSEVATARTRLLELVYSAGDADWDRTAALAGKEITFGQYLFAVVQEDVDVLKSVAQRIHESRPIGSPGFTAR